MTRSARLVPPAGAHPETIARLTDATLRRNTCRRDEPARIGLTLYVEAERRSRVKDMQFVEIGL